MTDMQTSPPPANPDDRIEQLLRLAGRRETPTFGGRARARAAAHEAWRETVRTRDRARWFTWMAPVAAAAVVILAVVVWRTQGGPAGVQSVDVARVVRGAVRVSGPDGSAARGAFAGDVLIAGSTVSTAPGETAALSLDGGGELRLNAASRIRLVASRRFALDNGQVYVDSGHTTGSTVALETFAGVIRDIGTRFDVRVEARVLRVRVRQGAVRLEASDRHVDAGEGQQLVARNGDVPIVSAAETYGDDWNWVTKAAPFRVEGATLDAFLRWIESDGGRRLEFADPALRPAVGATVLHGSIDGLTVDEALEVILPASGLIYRTAGARVIISRDGGAR